MRRRARRRVGGQQCPPVSRAQGAEIPFTYHPLYSLVGFLVGALVGMTGVGGGSLMPPILVLLLGFHPATAVGTHLLYASVTTTVGTPVPASGENVVPDAVEGPGLRSASAERHLPFA